MAKDNLLKWSMWLFLGLGIFLAIFNVWLPYSYWWDELYSVTASSLPMNEMFSKFIMNDVHPPLYQIVLSFWINLFGTSEFATRSLSLIFSLLAIIIFTRWSLVNLPLNLSAVAIIVFSTSFLFSFYSQETRSYTMMLFLSTLLTVTTLNFILKGQSIKTAVTLSAIALLLSLTHFFGFIFAGLILLYLFIVTKPIKPKSVFFFAGLLALIWPITHFLLGGLTSKTGGNFWIKSDGVQSTLQTFFNALVQQSTVLNKLLPESLVAYVVATSGVVIILILAIYVFMKELHSNSQTEKQLIDVFKFAVTVILFFVLVISAIDLYTPISTTRNFIVVLPIFSIFLAYLFLAFYRLKTFHLALVILFGLSSVAFSYLKLNSKQYPSQNHVEASNFIVENDFLSSHNFYYRANMNSSMPEIHNLMARFYLDKLTDENFEAKPLDPENIVGLDKKEKFVFFSQHSKVDTDALMAQLKQSGFVVEYFEPNQKAPGSVFVIYTK